MHPFLSRSLGLQSEDEFSHQDHQEIWFEISPIVDPIECSAIRIFFIFSKLQWNYLVWNGIISYKSTHTQWIKELCLPVWLAQEVTNSPPDIALDPCTNRSDATRDIRRSRALSLSWYWIGICYLAGSTWQICFEYIIYPVLCSFFFFFHFPFFLMRQPPGQSSPPQAKRRLLGDYLHRSATLLPLAWTPFSNSW